MNGFLELIQQCGREPQDTDNFNLRLAESQNLTAKIGAVEFAAGAARRKSSEADRILELTRDFCRRTPLTGDVICESQKLTQQIAAIR